MRLWCFFFYKITVVYKPPKGNFTDITSEFQDLIAFNENDHTILEEVNIDFPKSKQKTYCDITTSI